MTDTAPPRPVDSRALENSEQEFLERYAPYAVAGTLSPQVEGSPLMEFSAAGRVLYLFDRTGPYTASAGQARVVVHGLLDLEGTAVLPTAPDSAQLTSLGVSAVEGSGQVLLVSRRTWVVQSRLTLVLSSMTGLPAVNVGQWISFRTLPPLHGFLTK